MAHDISLTLVWRQTRCLNSTFLIQCHRPPLANCKPPNGVLHWSPLRTEAQYVSQWKLIRRLSISTTDVEDHTFQRVFKVSMGKCSEFRRYRKLPEN